MSVGAVTAALVLLALNAFFVAAEFALLASRRSLLEQLAAAGDRRAHHAVAGLRELSLMLAAAQLGITMASLGLGVVAEPALVHYLEEVLPGLPEALREPIAFTIGMSIIVFLHMVVGEMAPKSITIAHPEQAALLLARPFRGVAFLLSPFTKALNAIANGLVRLVGVTPQDERAQVHSPADLRLYLRESGEGGEIAPAQRELLERALELSGLDAESAMVPRGAMVAVPAEATIDEIEQVAVSSGRSRLPVYDGDLDHVVGVLHIKDVLTVPDAARDRLTAKDLAAPMLVAPESRPVEDLMIDMRRQRQHMALVVDEFGGVSGLVALEDLLEEIIGEFEDESDRRQVTYRRLPGGTALLPGSARPDEVEDRTGVVIPPGPWETATGYVMATLGRLPTVGDAVPVPGGRLEVAKMDGHRVLELRLRLDPAETGDPAGANAPAPERQGDGSGDGLAEGS